MAEKTLTNEHTGAKLKVSGYSKQGEDNYDAIFRKDKPKRPEAPEATEEVKPKTE
jgi:hypothetical protein